MSQLFGCRDCRHVFEEPVAFIGPDGLTDALECPKCGSADFLELPEGSWSTQP